MISSLRLALLACLALLAAACGTNPLATWVPSPNFESRHPTLIVLHATEQSSVKASLDTLRTGNAGGRVSAHYLIGRDGHIYQLVREDKRAWHAGGGSWGTISDLNSASIGIELDNDGNSEFADAQIAALMVLLGDVCQRLEIPRAQVIGHADLAPWRKTDPGPRFPWARLAQAGFGTWPDAALLAQPLPPDFDGWLALRLIGYSMRDPQGALRAFRMHYRGIDDPTSPMSDEDRRILRALTRSP